MSSFELGVNRAGRPYRLHPAADGRELRSELLPMPPIAELLKDLEDLEDLEAYSKEEILVKAFARGATIGFSRGLRKRVDLIGELVDFEIVSLHELRNATHMSESHLRRILLRQGVRATTRQVRAPARPTLSGGGGEEDDHHKPEPLGGDAVRRRHSSRRRGPGGRRGPGPARGGAGSGLPRAAHVTLPRS